MTSINKDTVVSLIDTSSYIGNVILPLTTDISNRILIFKDSAGTFNTNPFTLSTTGYDSFENSSNITTLSNNFESICLYSDPNTFTWKTLFSYDTADHNPSNWSLYPAKSNVDISGNVIQNVNQLNVNYIYGNGMGSSVTFGSVIDMYTNEISNMAQTSNINSAATNVIGRRVYFDNPIDTGINNTTYSNVLTISPTTPITYNNPTAFYTYLNCTISFRCDGAKDDLAYFLKLSNITTTSDLSGEIFNRNYPYIENQNAINTYNHSISFQEQFNLITWSNNDTFVPMLYVVCGTGTHTLTNMQFSMVYEPILN